MTFNLLKNLWKSVEKQNHKLVKYIAFVKILQFKKNHHTSIIICDSESLNRARQHYAITEQMQSMQKKQRSKLKKAQSAKKICCCTVK